MSNSEAVASPPPATGEDSQSFHDLTLRVAELEASRAGLEQENKTLRLLLEKVIAHRQKSHGELVMLLTSLISKLPINDIGGIVSRLVEHNSNLSQFSAALLKGTSEDHMPEPALLRTLDHTKKDLQAAVKPIVEELVQGDSPLEVEALKLLETKPEEFFSPRMARARRCVIKGQLPRERIIREFGNDALVFFTDLTTDPRRNPNPKPDEIVLGFRPDFEAIFAEKANVVPDKRDALLSLYRRVQASKASTPEARAQRTAFQKLTFILELLHFYEHQNEAPDVIFAQRLPALVEQLVVANPDDPLDEKMIALAESLIGYVINPDHRHAITNNMGKSGGTAQTLKYVLRLREEKTPELDQVISDFVKILLPSGPTPTGAQIAAVLRLIHPSLQKLVAKTILRSDRLRKGDAEKLGHDLGAALGLEGLIQEVRAQASLTPEVERQMAWNRIKDLINRRTDAATVAAAFRDRLHAKYDADEIRQSWIVLAEADPISLIRIFCQTPYLPNGKTDPIARTVLEIYVARLTHEKYAATYQKVVNSLKNMYQAKHDSPTLLNFLALVRWVSPQSADQLQAAIGMPPQHA